MGPKKKEEEIDLSTLPECKSINAIILCRGKKTRATTIIDKIRKEGEKFIGKIKKTEVLEHAKEKNIYVDPNTLNEKQKKDPKFMQSINTELTATVVAKAVQSLVSTLNVKIRLQKKNNGDKPIEDKWGRKYDILYSFDDLPDTKDQFEQLAKLNENIRYVLVIQPKLNWSNAPELPQEQNEDDQQEDDEVKEYKQLLKKQQKSEEDQLYQQNINDRINHIKVLRSQSNNSSQFRNCTISVVDVDIDPYAQEQSANEAVRLFFENINKLNAEFAEFEQWKKDKHAEKIVDGPTEVTQHQVKGNSYLDILNNIAQHFDEKQDHSQVGTDQSDILNLINGFSVDKPNKSKNKQSTSQKAAQTTFVSANQGVTPQLQEQLRQNLKYPGINRFMMPQTPAKSQKLRTLLQAQYSQFTSKNIDINQLFRRTQILNFEQFIKQFDQDRTYSFIDRVYQQHHDKASLQRELYKANELNEYNTFSKYDDNTDKLYLMLVYKNNARRTSKKIWESNWKVIPNYQSWLEYFRNNQNNLNNTQYYDIDYQKIGNIQEISRFYTVKSGQTGAVIVNKECMASNIQQSLLYGLKNQFVFGIHQNKFYSQNNGIRIYHHTEPQSKSYESVILLPQGRIRLWTNGNILFQINGKSRLITPGGYTIIYEKEKSVILHPNGSITYSKDSYINELGYGLKNGHLVQTPTLKRTTNNGEIIKRDDNTVIVNKVANGEVTSKWIQFYEGTEYHIHDNQVKIQKKGQPFVTCANRQVNVVANELSIELTQKKGNGYEFKIEFNDGTTLRVHQQTVSIFQKDQQQQITVNIAANKISSNFEGQQLSISTKTAQYLRKGKKVDAREDVQKYGDQDVLPADYIQPRLFVINNDNSGMQILSQKMVLAYLKQHDSQIEEVYQQNTEKYHQYHIVGTLGKTKGKFIKNQLEINLDVFDNTHQEVQEESNKPVFLRNLLKFTALTTQDIAELVNIQNQVKQWRKNNVKEENQFGYKIKDQASTKAKIQAKLLTVKMRQEKEPKVNTQKLKETAKNYYSSALSYTQQLKDKNNKEQQLRNQFMKKRDSIIQEYRTFPVPRNRNRKDQLEDQTVEGFLDHYFLTAQGKKALSQMPEWVFKPKQIKAAPELDPEIKNELNNSMNINKDDEQSEQRRERYDTVEVNLNPKGEKEIYIKPSVFTQRQIDEERFAFEQEKKAYKYHEAKRKDFNLYGQERKNKPEVPTLLRTQPISQINQKYLVTQAPLDKKVKISSMKNKLTSSASNMMEMRKQGPHSLLMKTLDKGNDINKLLQRRTMMVQADLNDKLQRDILINPVQANFGVVIERRTYELKIQIKNQDIISQRITLKRPKNIYLKVQLNQMGPIAMGMTRKIIVTLKTSSELIGKFADEFQIVTKHQIYHIPILAHILSESQAKTETLALSKGVTEVDDTRKKGESSFQLPRIK